MHQRFRYRSNFNRKFAPSKQPNQDLVWAISENSKLDPQNSNQRIDYIPKHKFEDFPVSSEIKKNVASKKYVSPTPIQDQAIPAILAGSDVIGIANTGTGKTAAFLIPLVDKILKNPRQKVLIVVPTRELVLQIEGQLFEFAWGLNIKSALCIGGASLRRQRSRLLENPNFVIGTPGRIKDLIGQNCLDLSQFANVVLDEADRMVDIGFIGDIKYFISLLPVIRQSLFFSATIPPKVQEIIQTFVKDPVTISVKSTNTPENINQEIVKVADRSKKVDKLHDLLIQDGFDKVLIFGRTKWGVQKLADELKSRGFKAGSIHGNKSQNQRQKTLELFSTNQIRILLATDVASRGLDIDNVSHVINYDMPSSYDDYVHRIGRTGRANKRGTALTFVV